MKEKFTTITSTCVPMPAENIDTDRIIPARFLKSTSREGFGEKLFYDQRFDADGNQIADFPLNNPAYGGVILVAGKNFGCGSSREHAAWAIHDYGFRVVVSSFFADIHKNNELNSFVLPVTIPQDMLDKLLETITADPTTKVVVDLENQTIKCEAAGIEYKFEINPYKKYCLLNGLDDVDYLLSRRDDVVAYENKTKK
ncbi:MAG: 3-isopropylmalate dehydratase small subunit [Bacteroides sp.]|nr:3-isopropylmalate dehydratase small subunit [Bacteroides sp.]MDE5809020.1 3-isopropylmalate dehydratase small subunit [Muribaculaceae bacterium]